MKFIKKNPEPIEFIRWKEQEGLDKEDKISKNDWSRLQGKISSDKTIDGIAYYSNEELWDALLLEQGHICAYCGKRLKLSDRAKSNLPNDERIAGKIEHIEDRGKNPRLTFTYSNLVAVCDGEQYGKGKANHHCDTKKEGNPLDKRLHLTKTDNENLFALFSYSSSDGEMTATDDDTILNEQINKTLGLNVTLLKERRLDIIKNLFSDNFINEIIKARPDDATFIQRAIEKKIENIFSELMLEEYCFVKAAFWLNRIQKPQ
jgi:uncharacterized protein (TIGR02646 family)